MAGAAIDRARVADRAIFEWLRRDRPRPVRGPQAATRTMAKEVWVRQEQGGHRSRRSSPRLEGFDYSQESYYFVTICTRHHRPLLGTIRDGLMRLSPVGQIVEREWLAIPEYESSTHLDTWIVMPNHLHGIISLHEVEHGSTRSLSSIIAGFKGRSTRNINRALGWDGTSFWQRSFYDHVVRNDADLGRIREYISNNPARWEADRFFR